MSTGTFSLNLHVESIEKSLEFYNLLGFAVIDGGHLNNRYRDTERCKWRILSNQSVKIGLFQGMLETNILTFHVRDVLMIQETLRTNGIRLIKEASQDDELKSIILADPDGNRILYDQI